MSGASLVDQAMSWSEETYLDHAYLEAQIVQI